MTVVPDDPMQDWREVDLGCSTCGECWSVRVYDGEPITVEQAKCECGGEGAER